MSEKKTDKMLQEQGVQQGDGKRHPKDWDGPFCAAERREQEERAFKCCHWSIRSPRFNEEEVLTNSKTKCVEGVLITTIPVSYAWMSEHFPGWDIHTLFVQDRRVATKKVQNLRNKRRKIFGAKGYTPSEDEL